MTVFNPISLRKKFYLVNIIAEFLGSALFSLLYFLFISRFLTPEYDLNIVIVGLAIGLSYFLSVYIPFHTYRIHIIPFITIIKAIQHKSIKVLVHKLPAQLIGAFLGVFLFNTYMDLTGDSKQVIDLWVYYIDPYMNITINAIAAFILIYFFLIIRVMFKSGRFYGTFLLSVIIATIFMFSSQIHGLTALNPFGYLVIFILNISTSLDNPWYWYFISYAIIPSVASIIAYFYLTDVYRSDKSEDKKTTTYWWDLH